MAFSKNNGLAMTPYLGNYFFVFDLWDCRKMDTEKSVGLDNLSLGAATQAVCSPTLVRGTGLFEASQ